MYRTRTYNMYWFFIIINHIYGLAGFSTIGTESCRESAEFYIEFGIIGAVVASLNASEIDAYFKSKQLSFNYSNSTNYLMFLFKLVY
jgi:hypothetical protein